MQKTVMLLAAMALASACGTAIQTVPLNAAPRPLYPKAPEQVHIYSTGAPNQPYVEVAALQGRQESRFSGHDMPEIINEMRMEAGRMGCDGLIIQGPSDVIDSDGDDDVYTLEGFAGVCIVFANDVHGGPPVDTVPGKPIP